MVSVQAIITPREAAAVHRPVPSGNTVAGGSSPAPASSSSQHRDAQEKKAGEQFCEENLELSSSSATVKVKVRVTCPLILAGQAPPTCKGAIDAGETI